MMSIFKKPILVNFVFKLRQFLMTISLEVLSKMKKKQTKYQYFCLLVFQSYVLNAEHPQVEQSCHLIFIEIKLNS